MSFATAPKAPAANEPNEVERLQSVHKQRELDAHLAILSLCDAFREELDDLTAALPRGWDWDRHQSRLSVDDDECRPSSEQSLRQFRLIPPELKFDVGQPIRPQLSAALVDFARQCLELSVELRQPFETLTDDDREEFGTEVDAVLAAEAGQGELTAA